MAAYNQYNPIRSVAPYNTATNKAGTAVYVPSPSVYQYNLSDVSNSDAGRTEDTMMHVNRIGQKVHLSLEWWNLDLTRASEVLTAFNDEYIQVVYLDAKSGSFLTKVFYVGDRATPLYNSKMGLWGKITFNIIER